MKTIIWSFLLLATFNFSLIAQEKTYFQQTVNYGINVTLNDVDHILSGAINIEYTNNSPDKLDFIYFHLWPNAYKNTETAFARQKLEDGSTRFYFSDEKDRGEIRDLDCDSSFTKTHKKRRNYSYRNTFYPPNSKLIFPFRAR